MVVEQLVAVVAVAVAVVVVVVVVKCSLEHGSWKCYLQMLMGTVKRTN